MLSKKGRTTALVILTCTKQDSFKLTAYTGIFNTNLLVQPPHIHPAMGDLRHLVLVKFKEGVVVEELLEGMGKLVSNMDTVKSFEWGQDVGSEEMLRQGFTHVFLMTFRNAEDLATYSSHPSHVEFANSFTTAIEKVLLFDFPAVVVKPSA